MLCQLLFQNLLCPYNIQGRKRGEGGGGVDLEIINSMTIITKSDEQYRCRSKVSVVFYIVTVAEKNFQRGLVKLSKNIGI